MIEQTTLARPYAKAIFELAQKNKSYLEWSDQLKVLSQITQNQQVQTLLRDITIPLEQVIKFYKEVASSVLTEFGKNLIQLLIIKKRLCLLPHIARLFEFLRAEAENSIFVEVVTAVPLNELQKSAFMSSLEKRFGKMIKIKTAIDQTLMGGYQIKAGDVFVDGSLKGSLEQLKEVMGG